MSSRHPAIMDRTSWSMTVRSASCRPPRAPAARLVQPLEQLGCRRADAIGSLFPAIKMTPGHEVDPVAAQAFLLLVSTGGKSTLGVHIGGWSTVSRQAPDERSQFADGQDVQASACLIHDGLLGKQS